MSRIASHRQSAGVAFAAGVTFAAAGAVAQPYTLGWSALTAGGQTIAASAGPYTLKSSLGQPLAGSVGTAGPYSLTTGFSVADGASCYANCDNSAASPVLNVGDFTCFLQKYAAADLYANCDGSTAVPVLNVGDFTCFLQKYAAGCP